jgi:hypothetical protein
MQIGTLFALVPTVVYVLMNVHKVGISFSLSSYWENYLLYYQHRPLKNVNI